MKELFGFGFFVSRFTIINTRIDLSDLILRSEIYFDRTSEAQRPHFSVLFCFYEIISFLVFYDIRELSKKFINNDNIKSE